MFTAFRPPEHGTRERRAQFPDESWIGFPSLGIEVAAKSQADVTVTTQSTAGAKMGRRVLGDMARSHSTIE